MALEEVVRAPAAARIADIVERMRTLDAALPEGDGIASFKRLYLADGGDGSAGRTGECLRRTLRRDAPALGAPLGRPFALWVVRDEEHLAETCDYVRANPIRAGICERTTDYRWSNARQAAQQAARACRAAGARAAPSG